MLYILLVAMLNIVVGFAVAVRLGSRYRAMVMADERWVVDQLSQLAEEPATRNDAEGSGADAELNEKEEGSREKSNFAMAVEALQAQAEGLNDQLTETDDQLRVCLEDPEAAEIEDILGSLREATDDYLDKRNAAHDTLNETHKEDEGFDSMRAEIEAAITNQNKSIELVNSAIDSFDYEGDLHNGCRRMIDETGQLIDGNRQFAGELDKAAVEAARQEDRLETTDDSLKRDTLTGLSNRAGMEATMAKWWEGDSDRIRQLSMVMVDLDKLEDLNKEHGQKVGNAIIRGVAQLLTKEIGEDGAVARVSGRCFLLTCLDTDVREATRVAEHARQTLENMSFLHKETRIKVTASCAVAEATPEDTTESLFSRVETTLLEAKRYGHNRTFLFEGDYPAPVAPPSFDLSEKEVVI